MQFTYTNFFRVINPKTLETICKNAICDAQVVIGKKVIDGEIHYAIRAQGEIEGLLLSLGLHEPEDAGDEQSAFYNALQRNLKSGEDIIITYVNFEPDKEATVYSNILTRHSEEYTNHHQVAEGMAAKRRGGYRKYQYHI